MKHFTYYLKYRYFLFVLFFPITVISQTVFPLHNDSIILVSYQKALKDRHRSVEAEVKSENSKYILIEYQKRHNYIKSLFDEKLLVTDTVANNYLNRLVNLIIKTNPGFKQFKPAVYFSRAWWPNASSYGEGTILFNISLFNRLSNESQAVFILCHELSHYFLNHSGQAVELYVNTINSESFKKELKEINNSPYQRNKRADELLKNISYSSRRHSRNKETEADSLALELLRSTGYDTREAISCLSLLDSVDIEKYSGSLHLKEQLNFPDYPFRNQWIKVPSPTLGEAMSVSKVNSGLMEDSLKTHPDCSTRIAALSNRAFAYHKPSQQTFLVNESIYHDVGHQFDIERIAYCMDTKQTGRALYFALQMFYQKPQYAYLATTIGNCLNSIYLAQKAHVLGTIIDNQGGTNDNEYEEFLRFLHTIRLNDIAALSYHFMQKHKGSFGSDKNFQKALTDSQNIFQSINQ